MNFHGQSYLYLTLVLLFHHNIFFISITLPQGEWPTPCIFLDILSHFNPHSHKGSDASSTSGVHSKGYFNPHSHKGSDAQSKSICLQHLSFQSTLLQGEWHVQLTKTCAVLYFNPHSHKGSDWEYLVLRGKNGVFQSTLPQREWLDARYIIAQFLLFQSTLPQREWPAICAPVKLLIYFNPHSRKGSDHLPAYNRRANRQISIHTPAKGVTFLSFGFPPFAFDFNPHSRKGSDKRRSCFWCRVEHFNPHSRKGSDKSVRLWLIIFPISIHTPAKGVTPPYFKDLIFSMYFNPHSRKGSDVIDDSTGDIISQFQSTLPQREWLCSKFQKLILDLFQSTLPQREWPQAYFKTYNDAYVSIHTPAKGVTWVW